MRLVTLCEDQGDFPPGKSVCIRMQSNINILFYCFMHDFYT